MQLPVAVAVARARPSSIGIMRWLWCYVIYYLRAKVGSQECTFFHGQDKEYSVPANH